MTPPTRKLNAFLALAGATLVLLVTACGGGDSSGGGTVPSDPDLTVVALDVEFDQESYTAPAGEIAIAYDSNGQQVHSMVLDDANGTRVEDFRLQVAPGKAVGGVVDLPAGTYTMICDIPGHEALGMVAQLVVT
jgi:plastocyanin